MGAEVEMNNITEDYGVLSIAGPRAGQLLSRITDSQVKLLSAEYSGAQVWSATLQDHR
jgi:glycine cleavage system aminomethyltransferase T